MPARLIPIGRLTWRARQLSGVIAIGSGTASRTGADTKNFVGGCLARVLVHQALAFERSSVGVGSPRILRNIRDPGGVSGAARCTRVNGIHGVDGPRLSALRKRVADSRMVRPAMRVFSGRECWCSSEVWVLGIITGIRAWPAETIPIERRVSAIGISENDASEWVCALIRAT